MANQDQLEILSKGPEIWNEWRKDNLNSNIDLSNADLSRASLSEVDLAGVDLSQADLWKASLSKADLSEANLSQADLSYADLSKAILWKTNLSYAKMRDTNFLNAELFMADLSRAILWDANLSMADLTEADFSEADLSHANLSHANLSYANLSEVKLLNTKLSAEFSKTKFGNIDLRGALDLKTAKHHSPSSIGIDTIYKSKGKIPQEFLRGAGVPEEFIKNIPSLIESLQPIQFYSCFISFSSKNEIFARQLYKDLKAKGLRIWFAPEDLKIGTEFEKQIRKEIRFRDKLILVISKDSIESKWVEYETKQAIKEERRRNDGLPKEEPIDPILFPVTIDDEIFNTDSQWAWTLKKSRHIGDFRDWENEEKYQKAFNWILRDLEQSAQREM